LLAAAGYRLWRLAAEDSISDRPRDALVEATPPFVDELIACPWCLGFWIGAAGWAAYQAQPERTVALAAPWAISTGIGVLAHALKATPVPPEPEEQPVR
jgi:hypothetical protein